MIVFSWIYGTIWTLLPLLTPSGYKPEGVQTSCTFDYISRDSRTRTVIMLMITVGISLPVLITSLFYTLICIHVRYRNDEFKVYFNVPTSRLATNMISLNKGNVITNESSCTKLRINRSIDLSTELYLVRNSVLNVLVFVLAWLPYVTMALLAQYSEHPALYVTPKASILPILISKLSAVLNPVFYVFTNSDFKKYAQKLKTDILKKIRRNN
jgi:r-opsin